MGNTLRLSVWSLLLTFTAAGASGCTKEEPKKESKDKDKDDDEESPKKKKKGDDDDEDKPAKKKKPEVDEDKVKKLLADKSCADAKSDLVAMGGGVAPLVEKEIQRRILAVYKTPQDKQWGKITEIYDCIAVLDKVGADADPTLEHLCGDLKTQSKLGKDQDTMYRDLKKKICAAIDKHGGKCVCEGK